MGCCHPLSLNKDSIDSSNIYLPYVVSKNAVLNGKVYDELIKPNLQEESTGIKRIHSINSDLAKAPTAFNSKVNLLCNQSIYSQSSWNSDSDSEDDNISQIQNQELADILLSIINDMRNHPQKYLNRIIKFLKPFNYKSNSLNVKDSKGNLHLFTNCVEPDYIITYLEKVASKPNISKCIEYDENAFHINIFKVLDSPLETLFSYLIVDKENIRKIYEENPNGIVISFKNKIQ